MQAALPRNPDVKMWVYEWVSFASLSIHSLAQFSRSVHTIIHCLETLIQLKWHLWSTDTLKIPDLFLSILIPLSFSHQQTSKPCLKRRVVLPTVARCMGEEGLFQLLDRMKPHRFGELQSKDLDSWTYHVKVSFPLHPIQQTCSDHIFQLSCLSSTHIE